MRRRVMLSHVTQDTGNPIGIDLIELGLAPALNANDINRRVSNVRPGEVYEFYSNYNSFYRFKVNAYDSNDKKITEATADHTTGNNGLTNPVTFRITIPEGTAYFKTYLQDGLDSTRVCTITRIA